MWTGLYNAMVKERVYNNLSGAHVNASSAETKMANYLKVSLHFIFG